VLAPQAGAQPPAFPDLAKFADADPALFIRPFSYAERWANGYLFFRTPDGISCAIGGSSWCIGQFPGAADQSSRCSSVSQGGDTATPFELKSVADECAATTDTVLNIGQKLTNATFGISCAVGEDRLTACIGPHGDHGFVLQPSGSWVF
jgi:hypothetical protein